MHGVEEVGERGKERGKWGKGDRVTLHPTRFRLLIVAILTTNNSNTPVNSFNLHVLLHEHFDLWSPHGPESHRLKQQTKNSANKNKIRRLKFASLSRREINEAWQFSSLLLAPPQISLFCWLSHEEKK